MSQKIPIRITVNGIVHEREVEPRLLLADFLRHELELTGTHVGCEHGVCGACTVMVDGASARSCLLFAAQLDGARVTTVEGLVRDGDSQPIQDAFHENHALQCGYCTPGFLITLYEFLADNPEPTEQEVREALSGNLCRCTGYLNILKAVQDAAGRLRAAGLRPAVR
ncbi:MAG: (2Fe-2S)-binding protein [Candidatus Rokubacteria bacterium]|nr:(2Fe-2S)-binding protein [Candidatus Rokubacteria bacterium]